MEKINKTIKFNKLLASYGGLLSAAQKEILESYYLYDLSISEIATERGVSRAAIEDALQKGNAKLEEIESVVHAVENQEEILKITAEMKENTTNPELLKGIELIERRFK